jgi:hypothetical protein
VLNRRFRINFPEVTAIQAVTPDAGIIGPTVSVPQPRPTINSVEEIAGTIQS